MSIETDIAARLGVPLGPTLKALTQLAITCDYLEVGPEAWSWSSAESLERDLGIVIVAKTGNGFFGPRRDTLAKSASAASWIYADRQGLPPERVGKLADFLALWCYVPDFFELHDQDAAALREAHRDFFSGNPDMRPTVKRVLAIRGVKRLASGDEAAKLIARVGGLVNPEPPPTPVAPMADDEGQDFEVTKQRIREIEERALAKLRALRNKR